MTHNTKSKQLKSLNTATSLEDIQDTNELLKKLSQVSSFKCEVTGLMHLHNFLAYVRETKSAQKLLIYDISSPSALKVREEDLVKVLPDTEADQLNTKLVSPLSRSASMTGEKL